jgi:hypothetical protein
MDNVQKYSTYIIIRYFPAIFVFIEPVFQTILPCIFICRSTQSLQGKTVQLLLKFHTVVTKFQFHFISKYMFKSSSEIRRILDFRQFPSVASFSPNVRNFTFSLIQSCFHIFPL